MTDRLRRVLQRHPDAIAVALLAVAITAALWSAIAGSSFYFERDVTIYFQPMKSMVRDALLSGELPMWNPRIAGGQPMAANPAYSIFYPLQWLILIGDAFFGFRLHLLVHFYLAAFGMYAFCRSLGLHPAAAFFGGLTYGIGGPLMSLINVMNFLFALTWIPWILLFTRRFLLHRNWRDFSAAAILMGIQATLSEPVTLLQTWGLIAAYSFYVALRERRKALRTIALAALLSVVGALAGAVQLFPSADHARDSVRRAGLTYEHITDWSTPAARVRELVFPGSLRRTWNGDQPAIATMYRTGRPPFIADVSLGVLGALLLALSVVSWTRRTPWLLGGIAVAWIIALGEHTPLWKLLYTFGVRSIRYPEKFLFTATLLTVVLIAIAADRLVRSDARALRVALICAGIWTALVALIALGSSGVVPSIAPDRLAPHQSLVSPRTFWLDLAARGALVAVLFWLMRNAKYRLAAIAVAGVFATADIVRFHDEIAPRMPREYFAKPPVLATPIEGRLFHVADWEWAANDPSALEYFRDSRRYWWMIRNGAFPLVPAGWGYELALQQDFDETHLQVSADFLSAMLQVRQQVRGWPRLFESMAGVTHRAELVPADASLDQRTPRDIQPVRIVPAGVNARFYFAEQIEKIGGRYDFIDRVARQTWSDRVAFVEQAAFTPAPASVVESRQRWNTIDLEVESTGRALLIAAVTPHKYWRAEIDGKPAAWRVANVASMAVEVPAGRHRVHFRYRNPVVLAGAGVSLLVFALLAICFFVCARSPGSDSPSPQSR